MKNSLMWRLQKMSILKIIPSRVLRVIVMALYVCHFQMAESIRIENSAYQDIVIEIRETVPNHNCTAIINNIEATLTAASEHLYTALDGRAYFGSVIILLPTTWTDKCVPSNRTIQSSQGEPSDITITKTNHLFGDRIWTQQSGGCGEQGDQIYVSHLGLDKKQNEHISKEFVREWAKYRYGIFDEIGYDNDKIYPRCHFTDKQHVTGCSDAHIKDTGLCQNSNPFADMVKTVDKKAKSSLMFVPQADNIVKFCDNRTHDRLAPTKHNLLCNRYSTMDIIHRHPDFNPNSKRMSAAMSMFDQQDDTSSSMETNIAGVDELNDIPASSSNGQVDITRIMESGTSSLFTSSGGSTTSDTGGGGGGGASAVGYGARRVLPGPLATGYNQIPPITATLTKSYPAAEDTPDTDTRRVLSRFYTTVSGGGGGGKTNFSTIPKFVYRRRLLTRYMVIIDETQDTLIRESWNFLRNAIRKWIVYDLQSNTEIGIVLANDTSSDKYIDLTSLELQNNRDLIASFIPYLPSDSHQPACILCAINKSIEMLNRRRVINGLANDIILVIGPGIDLNANNNNNNNNNNINFNNLITNVIANKIRIVTINFPGIIRRQSLDILSKLTNGKSYTIYEQKYNSEKTFLNTYFELTMILYYVSYEYYEGHRTKLPIEIHRKILLDIINDTNISTKRISRIISGSFFIDDYMRSPSGFYIYTHNVELPLIQNIKLISPNGIVYSTRSDKMMPVKQLTLNALINITGPWTYMIERFNGNPQPHIVQAMATPINDDAPIIVARAWLKRSKHIEMMSTSLSSSRYNYRHQQQWPATADTISKTTSSGIGPLTLYCELKRGDYPIHSAMIQVTVTRPDMQCNYTNNCEHKIQLLDTGSGDPDITKGDGIYTRYFSTFHTGPGYYKFSFYIDDNGNTAYSLNDNASIQDQLCCGSVISDKMTRQTTPFQRYLAPITVYVTADDIAIEQELTAIGRIGDLSVQFLEEGKIRLTWTSPDMGGHNVIKYDIKYAMNIGDIIDNFDTAAILWEHDIPYTFSIGDITNFLLDINLEPQLFGEAVFFAIRPYRKLTIDNLPGPVSNPVRTYIPNKLKTLFPPMVQPPISYNDVWPSDHGDPANGNTNYDGSNRGGGGGGDSDEDIDIKVKYAIPMIAGMLFILAVIGIYCIFCVLRRRNNAKKRHSRSVPKNKLKHSKSDSNSNQMTNPNGNDSLTNINGSYQSPKSSTAGSPLHQQHQLQTHQQQQIYPDHKPDQLQIQQLDSPIHQHHQNQEPQQPVQQQQQQQQVYTNADAPDHHTVGIPIYSDTNENEIAKKERLSLTNLHEDLLIEELKYQHDIIPAPLIYTNCNRGNPANCGIVGIGVSIISSSTNNTLQRQNSNSGRNLSPYESWTASQLLHEHERRISPMDDILLNTAHNTINIHHPHNMHQHNNGSIDHDCISLNDSTSSAPPPVPPLPYSAQTSTTSNNLVAQPPAPPSIIGENPSYSHNAQHIYGIHSPSTNNNNNNNLLISNPQQQQIITPTYSTVTRNNIGSIYNPSIQGSMNSVNSGDKKRRNVTMV